MYMYMYMYMCICMYSDEEYRIGEYNDYTCERGIVQFMNCVTPGMKEKKN